MKLLKLSVLLLLCAALLFGCVALPSITTTRPDPADPTFFPGTTAAPTDPTQATTVPPVTTVPPTAPPETTTPTTVPPETTVPPTEPVETTAPPTVPPETTAPPTEPQPTECSHTYKTDTVPATCTTAGKETKTCTKCGAQQTKTLPATGHAYGAGTVLTEAATCADMGTIRYTCSRCGHSYDTAYRGNHRFGDPYYGSPHGYEIKCQDCGYAITDFYTWREDSFSDCDKNAALYTDTIRLKEPTYTGALSQWSDQWLDWYHQLHDILTSYGYGGVSLAIGGDLRDFGGSADAFMAEFNSFLDAYEAFFGWRPFPCEEPYQEGDFISLYFDAEQLQPVYERETNKLSAARKDAITKDLVAYYVHRAGLRTGMQLYNSIGKICDTMYYQLLTYDHAHYRYNSAFRGLTFGVTMCQGYSEIFQLFAEYCGFRSVIVEGSIRSEAHAWNKVTFSDGTIRYVDVTNLGADYLILVPWSHMAEIGFKLK